MSVDAALAVCEQPGSGPENGDIGHVHGAFAIEALEYCELLGVCQAGDAERFVYSGVEDARIGLRHMIGGGSLCAIHMLKKES
jgi:hypothetical protein